MLNRTNTILAILVSIIALVGAAYAFDKRYAKQSEVIQSFQGQQLQIQTTQISLQDLVFQQKIQLLQEEKADLRRELINAKQAIPEEDTRRRLKIEKLQDEYQIKFDEIDNQIKEVNLQRVNNFNQLPPPQPIVKPKK